MQASARVSEPFEAKKVASPTPCSSGALILRCARSLSPRSRQSSASSGSALAICKDAPKTMAAAAAQTCVQLVWDAAAASQIAEPLLGSAE